MARSFGLDVDVSALESLAGRLGNVTGDQLGQVVLNSVNEVATRAYATTTTRINAGITLTDLYVQSRVQLQPASDLLRPRAVIVAKGVLTGLAHYSPNQLQQPVKNPKRAKGDPARGIPRGKKQAGVSVEVTRGARKIVLGGQAFTIPKFKDSEGNSIIFQRIGGGGKGKVKALLGPSVYQLFSRQVEYVINDVSDDLQTTVVQHAEELLKKVLS